MTVNSEKFQFLAETKRYLIILWIFLVGLVMVKEKMYSKSFKIFIQVKKNLKRFHQK